ncbi:MAG: hypothetical protein ACLFVJ_01860 [Persicimonas sp.]
MTNSSNSDERYDELLDDAEEWDNRELGADRRYAKKGRTRGEVDEKVGLKMISIRLQEELIEDFKEFAERDGIGYQPLIRQILNRYASARRAQRSSPDEGSGGPQAAV